MNAHELADRLEALPVHQSLRLVHKDATEDDPIGILIFKCTDSGYVINSYPTGLRCYGDTLGIENDDILDFWVFHGNEWFLGGEIICSDWEVRE